MLLCSSINFQLYGAVRPGAVIPGYEGCTQLKPQETLDEEGTLILSNSPETVKETGILYRGILEGAGRLVFHHVNGTCKEDKRLCIVARNPSLESMTFQMDRVGIAPPLYHYLEAGNILLEQYYRCHTSNFFFLEPGEAIIIYESEPDKWKQHMVLSGMMDIYSAKPLEVTFASVDEVDALKQIPKLKPLAMDLAPRGTFYGLIKHQYLWIPNAKRSYYLIEDEETDWLRGKDELTGKEAINYGNYGVLYNIKLMVQKDANVYICPRGGIFQGTIRWVGEPLISVARTHYFKHNKERVYIGHIKKGEVKTLEYILPNGSAAPVLIEFEINE